MGYGVRDAVKVPRFLMCGKPCNCYSTREFVVLTVHVAGNLDLDISTATISFFFQTKSEVQWALKVLISIFEAILSFTDLHDKFCEACGEAGMVEECLKLLRGLKMCTHEFSDIWVSPAITERVQMTTSQPPCLCTRQNSEMVMVSMYVGMGITNPRGVIHCYVHLPRSGTFNYT